MLPTPARASGSWVGGFQEYTLTRTKISPYLNPGVGALSLMNSESAGPAPFFDI